ncbi:helix-turn-helix domain-containing protein [Streptomyces sp. ME01-18h]|uniref:helix-turn-helix domain-containing protein n=1 Tax=Streptomyces sp. ME01-18h TaxID=462920 RepID=UPI0029B39DE9|nr:helix-turn-helix domain-containing protein [Streptomyces sp. ME01-18h]MDX3398435.1 helix-turn-helix domain-containing protein [Streptomyces sp. ME01-18h]
MTRPKVSKGGLVTAEERAEIIRLHGEGKRRNEIARLTRRSPRTVSLICAEEDLAFDVTMTEDATRHRVAQLAERRAVLAEALQGDAERLTESLWQPCTVFSFGGKDNTYAEKHFDEPPAAEKRNLMAAANLAVEKSLKLLPPRDDDGTAQVGSLLTSLYDKLRDRHGDG